MGRGRTETDTSQVTWSKSGSYRARGTCGAYETRCIRTDGRSLLDVRALDAESVQDLFKVGQEVAGSPLTEPARVRHEVEHGSAERGVDRG